ncbi:uncharacterized protein LOC110449697 [Mizuhopecten yessoensis]|uniref:DUF5077 domain-containing protein n=1 Tax=Mizuhopecten yessoensis TaxID=6573 RepID=A0A210QQR3_MIZYE|nr:uncharacterized protein LOC110449697 [Mizuhopecten yessoensis]XP_021352406.1 uncharacterized protein LOC110449697 [Mizuhopecten yessoensis]OWF51054.1 hypothetical protein KP79_PYT00784 [Mizuhopecten yessoensis]
MTDQCEEPRAARSVHLWYKVPKSATSAQNTVIVRRCQTGTYFCAINFRCGYMGIQELYDGKKVVIFSVWDNKKDDDPETDRQAKIMYQGDGVDIQRFGGEGTGLRCLLPYDWAIDEETSFRVKAEKDGLWTAYSGHYFDNRKNKWFHIATLKTLTQGKLICNCAAFVEDFRRDGKSFHEKRKACFSKFQYLVGDKWTDCVQATFTADNTPVSNINAGCEGDGRFFLETGGDTSNCDTPLKGTVRI